MSALRKVAIANWALALNAFTVMAANATLLAGAADMSSTAMRLALAEASSVSTCSTIYTLPLAIRSTTIFIAAKVAYEYRSSKRDGDSNDKQGD